MGQYQPLSWMTLTLDYLLWGLNPTGYHLTNLALHCANALLLYFLSLRLLRFSLSNLSGAAGLPIRVAAGFAALFFSLHPLRVESVAWATQRGGILSATFFLGAVLCYLRAVEPVASDAGRRRSMRGAVVLHVLSLLSNPAGIILPLVLVILDVYPLRRLRGDLAQWFGPTTRSIWWGKTPFIASALCAGIVAMVAQYQADTAAASNEHGLPVRGAQVLFDLGVYLWKTFLPVRLSPLHELPFGLKPWDWMFLLSGVILLFVSVWLFVLRQRWPAVLASWVYYIVILASILGIGQSRFQITADRYTYLSCLSWAILAGVGVYLVWRGKDDGKIGRQNFYFANGLAGFALISLSLLTWKQTQVWHDSVELWRHILLISPESAFAHNKMGAALSDQGKFEEALVHFRQTLEISPKDQDARHNLGSTLARQGNLQEAVREFQGILQINPQNVGARSDLGTALAAAGELDEAIEQFQRVIRTDPKFIKAYYNLGTILAKKGQFQDAVAYFRQATQLDPGYAKAHYGLAFVQARRGEVTDAIEHYRHALKLNPGEFEIYFNYAVALAKQGNNDEAVKQFHEALRIKPDFAQGYHDLGLVLLTQGKVDEAIENLRMALRLQPESAETHQSLGEAFAFQGKRDEAMQHYQAALSILKERSRPLSAAERK